jgi:hypothetical protein
VRRANLTVALALANAILLGVAFWQAHLLRLHRSTPILAPPPGEFETSADHQSLSSSSSADERRAGQQTADGTPAAAGDLAASSPGENRRWLVATNAPRMDWRRIESADYRTYVKNLRDIGCPEPTVRDIVAADLLQAYAAKRAEVMAGRYRDFKFWKSDAEEIAARGQVEQQQRAVDQEMGGVLRELLGEDVASAATGAAWKQAEISQQLGFLPEDKRAKTLTTLLANITFDDQIRGLADGRHTPEDPGERRRVIENYDRQRTELTALLTPEEYEKVDMTVSWTADNLRHAMEHFQPTEEEFRGIFRAWRPHDENLAQLYATGQPDPGNARVFAQIKESLSPERYAKYVRTWWK